MTSEVCTRLCYLVLLCVTNSCLRHGKIADRKFLCFFNISPSSHIPKKCLNELLITPSMTLKQNGFWSQSSFLTTTHFWKSSFLLSFFFPLKSSICISKLLHSGLHGHLWYESFITSLGPSLCHFHLPYSSEWMPFYRLLWWTTWLYLHCFASLLIYCVLALGNYTST